MTLTQLRYTLAVAEEGNFTQAAEKCFGPLVAFLCHVGVIPATMQNNIQTVKLINNPQSINTARRNARSD